MRCLLLAALIAAPLVAAQPVCDGLEGDAARTCVRDGYRPSGVQSSAGSKDRLYDTVDRATVGGEDGVIGLYTGFFVPFDGQPSSDPSQDVFNNEQGINQEHIFPRSRGTDGNNAERDMHHLVPTRVRVNADRASFPFGSLDDARSSTWYQDATRTSAAPTEPDAWSQLAGGTFEPRASARGDVARAMFYVAAVYAAEVDVPWFEAQLEDLLAWHDADPATADDVARSERVAGFQSGCSAGACVNPFVTDATLARRAFAMGGVAVEPGASAAVATAVFPNPASGVATVAVTLAAPTAVRVGLVDALGREVAVLHDGPLGAGTTRLGLDAGRLAAGVYGVRVSGMWGARFSVVR